MPLLLKFLEGLFFSFLFLNVHVCIHGVSACAYVLYADVCGYMCVHVWRPEAGVGGRVSQMSELSTLRYG